MTSFALRNRVFLMTLAALVLFAGLSTFLTMSRREDPEMTSRTAVVACQWPGAPALKVDELIVDVLEAAIQRVDEVDEIRSTSTAGSAVIKVELDKYTVETAQVWDELRNEVDAVRGQLPSGASPPQVNSNFGDVSSLCLTLFQVPSPGSTQIEEPYTDRQLEVYAELIDRLVDLAIERHSRRRRNTTH